MSRLRSGKKRSEKKESFSKIVGVVAKARNGIFVVCVILGGHRDEMVDELFLKTVVKERKMRENGIVMGRFAFL